MIEKERFRAYKLEDERGSEKVVSIWLNEKDQKNLIKFQEMFNIKSKSLAYKVALVVALNLIGGLFGYRLAKYLFKSDRQKLSDFKDF